MRKISGHRGRIIACCAVMIITGCASESVKSLLEGNQERLQLNEALFDAVENGQPDLVRDLVRHGADVDVRGILGKILPTQVKNGLRSSLLLTKVTPKLQQFFLRTAQTSMHKIPGLEHHST